MTKNLKSSSDSENEPPPNAIEWEEGGRPWTDVPATLWGIPVVVDPDLQDHTRVEKAVPVDSTSEVVTGEVITNIADTLLYMSWGRQLGKTYLSNKIAEEYHRIENAKPVRNKQEEDRRANESVARDLDRRNGPGNKGSSRSKFQQGTGKRNRRRR